MMKNKNEKQNKNEKWKWKIKMINRRKKKKKNEKWKRKMKMINRNKNEKQKKRKWWLINVIWGLNICQNIRYTRCHLQPCRACFGRRPLLFLYKIICNIYFRMSYFYIISPISSGLLYWKIYSDLWIIHNRSRGSKNSMLSRL